MNEMHLSSEEMDVLRDLLKHVVDDMDVEVSRTDHRDFKEKLKHRRGVLEGVLSKLSSAPVCA